MHSINDSQLAVLIERVEHIAKRVDDIRPLVDSVNKLQNDHDHMNRHISQLMTNADVRSSVIHQLDKRILVLERWHKAMVGFSAVAMSILLAMGGYTRSFMESLDSDRDDTRHRLATMEFIINSPNFAKAMERQLTEAPVPK